MISALITLIIYLMVLGLLYWLVIYVIDTIPIPIHRRASSRFA